MSPLEPPPARQGWLHGLGEVLAFVWAGVTALGEIIIGRWPKSPSASQLDTEPDEAPETDEKPKLAEEVTPFPIHD